MITKQLVLVTCSSCESCAANNNWSQGQAMHARPSASITQCMGSFESDIHFTYDGHRVNAKSILGLLMLALDPGQVFEVEILGRDETEVMGALARLIVHGIDDEVCPDFVAFARLQEQRHGRPLESMDPLLVLGDYVADLDKRRVCAKGKRYLAR